MKENFNFGENRTEKPEKERDKEEKLEEIRMKIREMRSEALAKYKNEIESGGKIKEKVNRHLVKIEEEDIDKIPEDLLLLFNEVNNLTIYLDEDYDNCVGKVNKMFDDYFSELEGVDDAKKSYKIALAGVRSLIANMLAKKFLDYHSLKETKEAA
ncbi:MAG: hypothetical protein A2430_00275 [Candidatus Liptonbacteria bacterium RIFOXYC1_FULL_36_8]|uniref:Uncharacterized protein n=3 Tax=Candidatus Liptoniibacteriota TaxID=1817909 RepID=A0A1G2CPN5_9BACT|nr:MAG: hypothetical protein A2604_01045 [Candidatus Liptonbacteria bacterium RIFOXYD1_FULL_36_11]OGZ03067.1 MAG: hypothetical protein A2430_00275 [Candidatus Liptonbacteria bacterium RIFOXYC1_FULL_36_8]OGZ03207.1 MAG: hypothetical protein A2390_00640 [Candidatus Liptonbacteria bacterium RIFOXYB1_FULL_36_10]